MAVRIGDPPAPPRPRADPLPAGPRSAAPAPIALVLPRYERFALGAGGRLERVAVRRFPNGELHVEVPERVEGRRAVVVGSISPPAGNRGAAVPRLCTSGPRRGHRKPGARLGGRAAAREWDQRGGMRGRPQRGRGRPAGAPAHVAVTSRLVGYCADRTVARGS